MLFASWSMDATLILFIAIVFCKYVIFKDKESKGLRFIIAGGLFLLIEIISSTVNWSLAGIGFSLLVSFMLTVIALILVVLGSIKIILELFE